MSASLPQALGRAGTRSLWPAVAFLGGIFAWLVSVPLFGPAWFTLAAAAHVQAIDPIYLFLAAHAIGLAGAGLTTDVWPAFRRAGALFAAAGCLLVTLITVAWPALADVTFPLLGLLAAWGIVAWAPAFRLLVPLGRRALSFVGVPIAANAVKYALTLGIGHIAPAWLMVLASLPLLASLLFGRQVATALQEEVSHAPWPDAPPRVDLRPLWLLAPFLFVVYLSAGVSYSALTPSLLAALHTPVDPSLLAYVLVIPLLALAGDRKGMRNVAVAGPLLLGGAFLVWAAWPTPGGAISTQALMGAGYAAMDLLTWVALLEIAPPRGTATVFGVGLNMNVLPILIGAGLQAQIPWLEHLPPTTLAGGMLFLMLVAVAFFRDTSLLVRKGAARAGTGTDAGADAQTAAQRSLLPTSVPERLAAICDGSLSPRELEVARLVIEGRTVGEVARELVVSENTVKSHLASVYRKTGTRGRADLSAKVLAGVDGGPRKG